MHMNKVQEILQDLGFEEREVRIYLALLKNYSLTALQISKEVRIDRTTTYDILERLINKGIVSTSVRNGTKHFTALKPRELLLHFKEKYGLLANILPELNKITSQTKEPVRCELFQGKDGLKIVLKDLINSKKDYEVIGIRKEYEDILGYFNEQGVLKLDQFKVKEYGLVEKEIKFNKLKQGVYRYLNRKLPSPVTTLIYDNKVIFFIWTEPYFAILVENKIFAKGQEEYFNMLWATARPSQ